jgi:hypothetical protein
MMRQYFALEFVWAVLPRQERALDMPIGKRYLAKNELYV